MAVAAEDSSVRGRQRHPRWTPSHGGRGRKGLKGEPELPRESKDERDRTRIHPMRYSHSLLAARAREVQSSADAYLDVAIRQARQQRPSFPEAAPPACAQSQVAA